MKEEEKEKRKVGNMIRKPGKKPRRQGKKRRNARKNEKNIWWIKEENLKEEEEEKLEIRKQKGKTGEKWKYGWYIKEDIL